MIEGRTHEAFDEDEVHRLSKIFSTLSHPTRLKILALCSIKERSSKELRNIIGISKPLLIAHLRQLIEAGLLEFRAELDTENYVVRKYYKVKDFRLVINRELLANLVRCSKG